jgi:hypothetical protein
VAIDVVMMMCLLRPPSSKFLRNSASVSISSCLCETLSSRFLFLNYLLLETQIFVNNHLQQHGRKQNYFVILLLLNYINLFAKRNTQCLLATTTGRC